MTVQAIRAPRRLVMLLSAVVVLALTMSLSTASTAHAQDSIPVDGVLEDGGTFEGTIEGLRVIREGGQLFLTGTIQGVATLVDGTTETVPAQDFRVPLDVTTGEPGENQRNCPILNLDIGPIHLDLLGLVVDLSDIQLDVVAEPGPGRLLGNLLCAIAGLLDGPDNPLRAVTDLLNRLLRGLGLS